MIHLAVFASGNGSNAGKIIEYFHDHPEISVSLVVSDNPDAYVLTRADEARIPRALITRQELREGQPLIELLDAYNISFVVLAGFMRMIPAVMVKHFGHRMVNIHPALLPAYGGKGMYGDRVHQAVIAHHEKESGITIHYVNEHYDEGAIIFQARCPVLPGDTPETLAQRVHALEHAHYPRVIEETVHALRAG